MKSDN